ncbi:hypothetical protein DS2_13944 [Catenovulum agarivorans DS-2]|uniref:Uncharacterized protein n=1 Tax=Catenovulum agarivorans DS-2 TaxID=1328313 RepID=W7QV65_9ALTE|nr:hypothetical protein [Catenovulum agarivorans]EWH09180.1 hypothetical protein DS2_13944 [Catenovulum agarivorans DS-2]
MSVKKFVFALLSFIFSIHLVHASNWQYNNNRIAISADGNNQPDVQHYWTTADPDDWGATPAALAIIAKLNLQDRLVHFSYNNFIDSPAHTSAINQMEVGVQGAINYWQFDQTRFFDVTEQYQQALSSLVKQIAISTENNPLYYIHMGPSEFFYRVVKQVLLQGKAESLNHVYVLSHSGYNDNHLRRGDPKFDKKPVPQHKVHHTLSQAIELSGNRLKYKRIKDQNGEWDANLLWNSKHDWSVWDWMKNHSDPSVAWIYKRMRQHPKGVADCSDAGMVFYLLLGDENGSPEKFKQFIGNGIQ